MAVLMLIYGFSGVGSGSGCGSGSGSGSGKGVGSGKGIGVGVGTGVGIAGFFVVSGGRQDFPAVAIADGKDGNFKTT